MNNKSGFTLVELLAVIVILALIVAVAVPSTMSISNKIKKNMFCSKIDFIENAAKLYGEDKRDELETKGYVTIKVLDLVDQNYLKKDNSSSPYIEDPRDKSNSLDELEFNVGLRYSRVSVNFDNDINKLCDKESVDYDAPIPLPSDPEIDDELDLSKINVRIVSNNSKYVIDPDENYIYTADATDLEIIKNFEIEGNCTDCTLAIINDQIIVKYKNEILTNTGIDLVRVIILNGYNIVDNKLNVYESDIANFLSGIECRNCSAYLEKNGSKYTNGIFEKGDNYSLVLEHYGKLKDPRFTINIHNN